MLVWLFYAYHSELFMNGLFNPPHLPCRLHYEADEDAWLLFWRESATPWICCSSPSNRPDWTDSHQHTMGQSGPAHPASASCKTVTKTCASCKFLVVFQCPVANNNVLAMYQASTCISINVVQFLISKDF
jgi:hypothetical protein